MFKQTIIAVVLMSLLVGDSCYIEAGSRRPPRSQTYSQASESNVREKRFFNPFPKLFSIWNALTHIYSLYVEVSWSRLFVQCNRTQLLRNALCKWLHSPHNMLLSICLICLLFYVVFFFVAAKKRNILCSWANLWYRSRWFQRYVHVDDTANGKLKCFRHFTF